MMRLLLVLIDNSSKFHNMNKGLIPTRIAADFWNVQKRLCT